VENLNRPLTPEDFADYKARRLLPGGYMQLGKYDYPLSVFTQDEKYFLTGGYHRLTLYEVASGKIVWEIYTENRILNAGDFTPDGEYFLVIVSTDEKSSVRGLVRLVNVYETKTGKIIRQIRLSEEHNSPSDVMVCQDGKSFLVTSERSTLSQWFLPLPSKKAIDERKVKSLINRLGDDSYDIREKAHKELGEMGPAVIPFLEKAEKSPDMEVACRATALIKELSKARLLKAFGGGGMRRTRPSANRRYAAACQRWSFKTAEVWDVADERQVFNYNGDEGLYSDMAVSPDGEWIACAHESPHIPPHERLHTSQKKSPHISLYKKDQSSQEYVRHFSPRSIRSSKFVRFTGDSKYLFTYDADINILSKWDMKSLSRVASFALHQLPEELSPSGNYIATRYGDSVTIGLYSLKENKAVPLENESSFRFQSKPVAFSPDGKLCAQMLMDGKTCVIRNTETKKIALKKKLEIPESDYLLLSPDHNYLVVGHCTQPGEYLVVNISTGKVLWSDTQEEKDSICKAIAFSGNGKFLFARQGKLLQMRKSATGKIVKTFDLPGQGNRFWNGILSPDGKKLFLWSYYNAVLLDITTGKTIWELNAIEDSTCSNHYIIFAQYASDGNSILTYSSLTTNLGMKWSQNIHNVLSVLDSSTGSIISSRGYNIRPSLLTVLQNRYAVLYRDSLVMWDLVGSKIVAVLPVMEGGQVAAVAVNWPQKIIYASDNGSVWVWEKPEKKDKAVEDKE
ncbi:MAG: WD40 repeat domain-containing protein, partial [Planctomycetota bacterium]